MALIGLVMIGFGGGVAFSSATWNADPNPESSSPVGQVMAQVDDAGDQVPEVLEEVVDGGQAESAPETSGEETTDPAEDPLAEDGGFALGIDLEGRPFLGSKGAPVTVIEMTDFECPFCRRHRQDVMDDLIALYGDRIQYYVLNFPLVSIHPLALGAAEAAECAHDQGQYWDYSAALFDEDDRLVPAVLVSIAAELGMDVPTFSNCLTSSAKRDVVVQDIWEGERLGVDGTPTFFVNGRPIAGARPLSIFKLLIDAELESAGG